jgi:hypothetical protein
MAKGSYEIEIKSLLGAEENAQRFKYDLAKRYGDRLRYTSFSKQLNHYFKGGKLEKLTVLVAAHLAPAARKQLKQIATKVQGVSVRTRLINDEVRLVIKASLGTDSSANGVARMEFEEPVKLTLAELDKILIKAGFKYQAKWSRVREEFEVEGISANKVDCVLGICKFPIMSRVGAGPFPTEFGGRYSELYCGQTHAVNGKEESVWTREAERKIFPDPDSLINSSSEFLQVYLNLTHPITVSSF